MSHENRAETPESLKERAMEAKAAGKEAVGRGDRAAAFRFFGEWRDWAKKAEDGSELADALLQMGLLCFEEGAYVKALEHYRDANRAATRAGDTRLIALSYNRLGIIHDVMGDYTNALVYLEQGLKQVRTLNEPRLEGVHLINFGITSKNIGNLDRAVACYERVIAIGGELDLPYFVAVARNNLVEVQILQESWNALEANLKALELDLQRVREEALVPPSTQRNLDFFIHFNRARWAVAMAHYALALDAFRGAFEIIFETKQNKEIGRVLREFGEFLGGHEGAEMRLREGEWSAVFSKHFVGEVVTAEACLRESVKCLKDSEVRPELHKSLNALAHHLYRNGRFEEAFCFLEEAHAVKEGIFNESTERRRQLLSFQLEIAEIQSEAARARARSEELSAEVERRRATEKALVEAHEALQRTNEDVMSSIQYAKRIQEAMLPGLDRIQEYLGREAFFMLYRPRDIVSGDFYWFLETDRHAFFAVADCTGHGVPGAFMSMIGIAFLQQVVAEQGEDDPGRILDQLNRRVRLGLKQDSGRHAAVDGMEVILLRREKGGGGLDFASAGLPLYVVAREEGGRWKCEVLHGSRRGIGGRQRGTELAFQTMSLPTRRFRMIYLASDGYVDVANAERNPFGPARLTKLLETLAGRSVGEQAKQLNEALNAWQGGAPPRDDVTIWGLRL